MTAIEKILGDCLTYALDTGTIRPSDVPTILGNAAIRALDEPHRIAYSVGGCEGACCVTISTNPGCTHRRHG